jgi:hypothetical protein
MISLSPEITMKYPRSNRPDFPFWIQSSLATQRIAHRFFASRRWQDAGRAYRKLLRAFTSHPAQTQETYLQHLWFTTKTSLRFVALGALLFTHGVFPFLLTRTASNQVERIYLLMRSRIPQPRREIIESQYDI